MKRRTIPAFMTFGIATALLSSCGFAPSPSPSSSEKTTPTSYSSAPDEPSSVSTEESYEPRGYDLMVRVKEIMASMYCDSIFIKYGNWECLIDGGDSSDADGVSEALRTYCTDHKLDLYIGTHAHNDHMGIFSDGSANNNVFKRAGVTSFGYIIDSGSARNVRFMNSWRNVRSWMTQNGGKYIPAHSFFNNDSLYSSYFGKNVINITGDLENTSTLSDTPSGDVYLTVMNSGKYLTPGTTEDSTPNLTSVGVCLASFNQRFIMCGDAEGEAEDGFRANHSYSNGHSMLWSDSNDVYLKADHHGSDTYNSNNANWINWVNPDHVFVSAAIMSDPEKGDNTTKYGVVDTQHPYPLAVKRFEKKTYDIRWNGINGTYSWNFSKETREPVFQGSQKVIPYYHDGAVVTGEENVTFPMSKWCLSEKYSSCARTSPTGHDRKEAYNPIGSFTNNGYDYESFIARNTRPEERECRSDINEIGEYYDYLTDSYC